MKNPCAADRSRQWILTTTTFIVYAATIAAMAPRSAIAAEICAARTGLSATTTLDILPVDQVVSPWANETPVNMRSVEMIDSRQAMRADLVNWSPLAFDDYGKTRVTEDQFLEFWIRSSVANPALNLIVPTGVVCPLPTLIPLAMARWTQVQIPLSSLGYANGTRLGRVKLKSATAGPLTIWITGVRLAGLGAETPPPASPPAAPPPPSAPPPTSAVPPEPATIPPILWARDPGVAGEIDDHAALTTTQVPANGSDEQDDTEAFLGAINATASGGVIKVPPGRYFIDASLRLKSGQVLRGAGADRTSLLFTRDLTIGVQIGGGNAGATTPVLGGGLHETSVTVAGSDLFAPGDFGLLELADSNQSQVVRVIASTPLGSRTRLSLEEPLNGNFSERSKLSKLDITEFAGIENLSLGIADPRIRVAEMIRLHATANSWVRNVVSTMPFKSHVFSRQSYHCEIRDSSFIDASGHGDGGQGYGTNLANATTGCLVQDNVFQFLRHSVVMHVGANGNIVARNFSSRPRHSSFAEGGPGDISFHGFSNGNLVEANVVERIHLGDAGPIGAENTVLRNCLTSGPLTIENAPVTQVLLGNAMYGSDAQLKQTVMPPILPERPAPRPYLEPNGSRFERDGLARITSNWSPPFAVGNWYNGQRWTNGVADTANLEIPDTLFGNTQTILNDPVSGQWQADCALPAVKRGLEK